jgi:TRAP-type transport system periplasmic protein
MRKKIIFLLVVLIMIASTSFVQAKTVIRYATAFEQGHIIAQGMEKFKELVEKSEQEIEVQIFTGGSLGSEEELYEQVANCAVEMQSGGIFYLHLYTPQYSFIDVPYIMKDFDHMKEFFWNSDLGLTVQELLETRGNQKTLAIMYKGTRQMTANRPIYSTADLAGLKLRLPQIPSFVTIWQGMGAKPVPIPLPELFTALQTGVADASEGEPSQIWSHKLYEVQDYLIMTNHKVEMADMTINKDFFAELNEEQQEVIMNAATQASEWATEKSLSEEEGLIKKLEEEGMEIIIPDAAEFKAKAEPIIEELFRTDWPVTTWDEVLRYAD